MAIPGRPGNLPSEATVLLAYEKHCERKSYRTIAVEMAGDPHYCGGHSTARRWVAMGREVLTRCEDGSVDPNRKRRARRETAADSIDTLFTQMRADSDANDLPREAMYRLQLKAIELQVQLLGLRAAPEATRVKVTGSGGRPVVDPNLFASLAALPREEIDALLDDMLPDGRNQP